MLKIERRTTSSYYKYATQKYINLFYRLATKLTRDNDFIEDLLSIAKIELIKCLMCYNRKYGSLTTFIYHRVYGAMRHWMHSCNKESKIQYSSEINGTTYSEDNGVKMFAEECMAILNLEETTIIKNLFFHYYSLEEISRKMSIPRSTVFKIKERAINKMRRRAGVCV